MNRNETTHSVETVTEMRIQSNRLHFERKECTLKKWNDLNQIRKYHLN